MKNHSIDVASSKGTKHRQTNVPVIHFAPGLSASSRRFVKRSIEGAVEAAAKRNGRVAKGSVKAAEVEALWKPFLKLIESDAAAKAALHGLKAPKLGLSARRDSAVRIPVPTAPMLLTLTEHTTVTYPPYDWGWKWSTLSNNPSGWGQAATGSMTINGSSQAAGGWVEGAAGIGIKLRTDKPGSATVRPYFKYAWHYDVGAWGAGAWSDARGGVEVSVYRDGVLYQTNNGKPPVNRFQEFFDEYYYNFFDHSHEDKNSGDGIAVDEASASFDIQPGHEYEVTFGVYVTCNKGRGLLGTGGGAGQMDADILWIVVDRLVTG